MSGLVSMIVDNQFIVVQANFFRLLRGVTFSDQLPLDTSTSQEFSARGKPFVVRARPQSNWGSGFSQNWAGFWIILAS